MTVKKKVGTMIICGNYNPTINSLLKSMAPPNINVDIMANVASSVAFTKLDLAQAYNQMELTEESN